MAPGPGRHAWRLRGSTRFTARIHSRRCAASTGNLWQTERGQRGRAGAPRPARTGPQGRRGGRPHSLVEGDAALPAPPGVAGSAAQRRAAPCHGGPRSNRRDPPPRPSPRRARPLATAPPALPAPSVPLAGKPQPQTLPVGGCCSLGAAAGCVALLYFRLGVTSTEVGTGTQLSEPAAAVAAEAASDKGRSLQPMGAALPVPIYSGGGRGGFPFCAARWWGGTAECG